MGVKQVLHQQAIERRLRKRHIQEQKQQKKEKLKQMEGCVMCRCIYDINSVCFEQRLTPHLFWNDFYGKCWNIIMTDADRWEEEESEMLRYKSMNNWEGE